MSLTTPCRVSARSRQSLETDLEPAAKPFDDEFDRYLPTQPIHRRVNADFANASTEPMARDADLNFLEPSARPGSLGCLDHYEILEVRGHGGFGVVLKAFDEKLHRVVAVKVLAPRLAVHPASRRRFLREARAAAAVRDEHVVGIHGVAEGATPYLVMEYVDGLSLQEKIDNGGPLPLTEILRIGLQAARGLAAAHAQGLIHRDIKPGNILLENGVERVKITDFGLARAVDDTTLSQAGEIYGTPAYMAPEQAAGEAIDHRADLFSLGSVLYTMCTGYLPFPASTSLAVLNRVIEAKPARIREMRTDLPEWLEAFIAKLHAKKPDRRWATAQQAADFLAERLAESTGGGASPPSRARRWVHWGMIAAVMGLAATTVWFNVGTRSNQHEEQQQAAAEPTGPERAVVPFDEVQARRHQQAWAEHLQVQIKQFNTIDMPLSLVPPGEFLMGSADPGPHAARSRPQHLVRLSKAYFLGAHEVTVGQFRQFADATGWKTQAETDPKGGKTWSSALRGLDQRPDITWRSPGFAQTDDHPVCCVVWADADAFCQWLSEKEGKRYRLPTEAEWEFGCRAGSVHDFHYGNEPVAAQMNATARATTIVGMFSANNFGIYDMHGNVYEWTMDAMRTYDGVPLTDPRGSVEGDRRMIRGGGFSSGHKNPNLTAPCRGSTAMDHAYTAIGFRVVMEAPDR